MAKTVLLPDIGDFKEVAVIEIMVNVGDVVSEGQSIITVESDKASMEIPCDVAGTITAIIVKDGDIVKQGSPVLELTESSKQAAPNSKPAENTAAAVPTEVSPPSAPAAPPPTKAVQSVAPTAPLESTPVLSNSSSRAYASPAVRKFARHLGVDLSLVSGSGAKNRITKEDVEAFVKRTLSAPQKSTAQGSGLNVLDWPSLDFSAFGNTEAVDLSRIKKISGANLARNWVMIPHVTHFDEADITSLEDFRQSENQQGPETKLTILAFVIKACAYTLKKFPNFNSSIDEPNGKLILKQYYHIGFAADTPQGLMVPVVKDADKKGIFEIAADLARLSKAARDGKLGLTDMQGACFTVSSLGGIGGTAFTPIINAPEVAILGLSRSKIQPQYQDGNFVPRLMLPLSLSYDHRVIDGAQAARFSAYLAHLLTDIRKVML